MTAMKAFSFLGGKRRGRCETAVALLSAPLNLFHGCFLCIYCPSGRSQVEKIVGAHLKCLPVTSIVGELDMAV